MLNLQFSLLRLGGKTYGGLLFHDSSSMIPHDSSSMSFFSITPLPCSPLTFRILPRTSPPVWFSKRHVVIFRGWKWCAKLLEMLVEMEPKWTHKNHKCEAYLEHVFAGQRESTHLHQKMQKILNRIPYKVWFWCSRPHGSMVFTFSYFVRLLRKMSPEGSKVRVCWWFLGHKSVQREA